MVKLMQLSKFLFIQLLVNFAYCYRRATPIDIRRVPYMARVYHTATTPPQECVGVLLTNRWAMTAYGCVSDADVPNVVLPDVMSVCMGNERAEMQSCGHTNRVDVVKRIDEVALLRLQQPYPLGEKIGTARVPHNQAPINNKECEVVGWGNIEQHYIAKRTFLHRDKVTLELDQCTTTTRYCVTNHDTRAPCENDLGTPLICSGELVGMLVYDTHVPEPVRVQPGHIRSIFDDPVTTTTAPKRRRSDEETVPKRKQPCTKSGTYYTNLHRVFDEIQSVIASKEFFSGTYIPCASRFIILLLLVFYFIVD